jgi:hypothetical protein
VGQIIEIATAVDRASACLEIFGQPLGNELGADDRDVARRVDPEPNLTSL